MAMVCVTVALRSFTGISKVGRLSFLRAGSGSVGIGQDLGLLGHVADGKDRDRDEDERWPEKAGRRRERIGDGSEPEPLNGALCDLGRNRVRQQAMVHDAAQHCREAERHTDVGDAVEHDCPTCVGATLADERGQRGRRERQRGDEHEQRQVLKKQHAINPIDQREKGVMVDPDHADDEEADEIGGEAWPGLGKLVRETPLADGLDVQVEYKQRYRHREHTVAARLRAPLLHDFHPARSDGSA